MAKKEPDHFDFTPAHFTGDLDFQLMNAEQKGVYCTVIFYMYQNKGYCDLDGPAIATLCKCNGNFEKTWSEVEKKFLKTEKGLTHKRVLSEYKSAKKRMQVAQKSGLRGAKKRWGSHSNPNGNPNGKRNTKLNKTKLNKDTPLTPHSEKTKLFPIKGKVCSKSACRMPAVYGPTGEYDSFWCGDHMPEDVKKKYTG